jgi:hypothetical protein
LAEELEISLRSQAGQRLANAAVLVIVTDEGGPAAFGKLEVSDIVVQRDGELTRILGIPATPFVVAVSDAGVVQAATVATDFAQLAGLVEEDSSAAAWGQSASPANF